MSLAADMSNGMIAKPRRSRALAVLLSLIAPGTGHLYIGRARRGAVLLALLIVLQAVELAAAFLVPPSFDAVVAFMIGIIGLSLALYFAIAIDAARLARRGDGAPARWYTVVGGVVAVLAISYGFVTAIKPLKSVLPWRTYNAASTSMAPTLQIGDIFLVEVNYFKTHAPARGDVVVYKLPKEPSTVYIKRVVAVAGDKIVFREGRAVVNGNPVAETYIEIGDPKAFLNTTAEFIVPAGYFFAAGDNRANSMDSRAWDQHGPVPLANLLGRATQILIADDDQRVALWIGSPDGK